MLPQSSIDPQTLPPGRDLDAAVAEKVMGWTRHPDRDRWCHNGVELDHLHAIEGGGGDYYYPDESWSPSTDIAAAWEVVEKLGNEGYTIELVRDKDGTSAMPPGWDVYIKPPHERDPFLIGFARGPGPHAICLAALQAAATTMDQSV